MVAGFNAAMPTYQGRLKDREIVALIEYLKSLSGEPDPGESAAPAPSKGQSP